MDSPGWCCKSRNAQSWQDDALGWCGILPQDWGLRSWLSEFSSRPCHPCLLFMISICLELSFLYQSLGECPGANFCVLFLSESTWDSSRFPYLPCRQSPSWFSLPDAMQALPPNTGALLWKFWHETETPCSSEVSFATHISLQLFSCHMWMQEPALFTSPPFLPISI